MGTGSGTCTRYVKSLADRDRCLRVMRAVIAVLEAQAVPVNGGLEVPVVGDVHRRGRAFGELERRPRHRTVVRQHPHRHVADPLLDGKIWSSNSSRWASSTSSVLRASRKAVGFSREFDRRAVAVRPRRRASATSSEVERRVGGSPSPGGVSPGCRVFDSRDSTIRSAMHSASSCTQPISAEPRVCCQVSPMK